jgi:hypothetical protein
MRKPVVLKKESGKKIAIDAFAIDRVVEDDESSKLRTVYHKKGTTYAVTNTFDDILKQITAVPKKAGKDG